MDRRRFLSVSIISSVLPLIASGDRQRAVLPKDSYPLIAAVQQHMFPENGIVPSAKKFHATRFLEETIMHPTYDKDIREFIIEGAQELQRREKNRFLTYAPTEIEKALRSYEKTEYGSGWLDRIMLLSLEGMLSDPVYGGNYLESGWKALGTKGGDPRPTVRYAGK